MLVAYPVAFARDAVNAIAVVLACHFALASDIVLAANIVLACDRILVSDIALHSRLSLRFFSHFFHIADSPSSALLSPNLHPYTYLLLLRLRL